MLLPGGVARHLLRGGWTWGNLAPAAPGGRCGVEREAPAERGAFVSASQISTPLAGLSAWARSLRCVAQAGKTSCSWLSTGEPPRAEAAVRRRGGEASASALPAPKQPSREKPRRGGQGRASWRGTVDPRVREALSVRGGRVQRRPPPAPGRGRPAGAPQAGRPLTPDCTASGREPTAATPGQV